MTSNSVAIRVFRASRALLAPAKSSTSAASTASKSAGKPKLKPSNTSPKAAETTKATAEAKEKIAKESRRLTGIMKPVPLSPQLRTFMGVKEASRVDAVKQIWAYVKLKNLQNPADKKEIYCDDKLKGIFDGKEKVGFLEIGRFLSRHFIKSH